MRSWSKQYKVIFVYPDYSIKRICGHQFSCIFESLKCFTVNSYHTLTAKQNKETFLIKFNIFQRVAYCSLKLPKAKRVKTKGENRVISSVNFFMNYIAFLFELYRSNSLKNEKILTGKMKFFHSSVFLRCQPMILIQRWR